MPGTDTVGDKFYRPLQIADRCGTAFFWLASVASIATLLVNEVTQPAAASALQLIFVVSVTLYFIQGLLQRLHFFPRAEDQRRLELLSNAYGAHLTHEITEGYYNNDQTNPLKRLAASVMESAFFTKEITGDMLFGQRLRAGGYLLIYLVAVLNRSTDLDLIGVVAQAIFSEEIISRWTRLEWLRHRSGKVFDDFNRLFAGRPAFSRPAVQAQALDLFTSYETSKSTAAILLSSRIFRKRNGELTAEWDRIRQRLGI